MADGPCTRDHERPKEPRAKRAHGEGIGECTARVRTETVDNRYNIPDAVGAYPAPLRTGCSFPAPGKTLGDL